MVVYLADLTHTGMIVASNVMPLGIGLIGANIKREMPDVDVELFKYPHDLDAAISRQVPDVVGFSNYSWSCNLGMEYARRIKSLHPGVVVLAGGPNYGSTDEEHADYWQRFPWVDFYIVKEGEQATVNLLKFLKDVNCDVGQVKACGGLDSLHYMWGWVLKKRDVLPRIKNLDLLPSPYTEGLMDKFFDDILIPLVHTTRGCPFKCSFCTEGTKYYDYVAKRSTLADDLEYIGARKGNLADLYISDANFGMFREDKSKAEAIAAVQAKYNWPRYIHVSGGKNHKERVLEVAGIIGGRMGVAASLQSTDPTVLANVRRENISVAALTGVARDGSRIDANTYAEIILNLPGDTLEKHTQSLRDAVNSGLSYLRMYQLIMLPETDLNTRETREKFGMVTRWRIMPRCFGRYSIQGEEFNCAEIEEICVAQDSLSFEDYLEARELDLTIEIFHNTALFRELFGLCQVAGIEWFDLLLRVHRRRGNVLRGLYGAFRQDTVAPLWDSRDQALAFAQTNLDDYLGEKLGTNELFNSKAVAFFNLQQELHDAIYDEAAVCLPGFASYLAEAKEFSLSRKRDLLGGGRGHGRYSYDFPALVALDFSEDPREHRRDVEITFEHDDAQRAEISQFVRQYGTTTTGLGRIMLRAHIKKLFRQIHADGVTTDAGFEQSYRRASNLYGD